MSNPFQIIIQFWNNIGVLPGCPRNISWFLDVIICFVLGHEMGYSHQFSLDLRLKMGYILNIFSQF
jgi:hypothetical protein